MLSLLHIQIIVDILFFVTILFLLHRLNKKIAQRSKDVDAAAISEFKKMITDSEHVADRFMTAMDDSREQLTKLVRQLDDRERKMVMLLEEADKRLQKFSSQKAEEKSDAKADQYEDVVKMVQQGMPLEEIIRHSGLTEGEINLVTELAKARKNNEV